MSQNPLADDAILKTLQANLDSVRLRIQAACERADRNPEDIQLVAVTKYADWAWVQQLAKLHDQFGENRPQQLIERQQLLSGIHWHLIGQLQRNKVRSVVPHCGLIHSIDSARLFQKVCDVATETEVKPDVLLQINISEEESKSGFTKSELLSRWAQLAEHHDKVNVKGFMTMAPANQNLQQAADTFRGLSELLEAVNGQAGQVPKTWSMDQLSMGMSGDFEVAIESGATIIRVGSALFDGLPKAQ
ncbi:MAG: YggS family pyridoxal phosphate-dependent enzyme [Fuerstiella sp.]